MIAERLRQELDRAPLHRLHGHRNIAVPGDEDDRDVDVCRRELSLKIETALPGQSDIEHQAGGSVRASLVQEFGDRGEGLGLQTDGTDQGAERLADLGVVIDDDDGRLFGHR